MANVKPSAVATVTTHLTADWRFAGSRYYDAAYSKAVTEWQYMAALLAPAGQLIGGYIAPSVASNNLTLAIKTDAGNDPSANEPVFVKINGTMYTITAATSTTKNAGTSWGNAGAAELAAKEIDWIAYVVYDSNSSVVAISASRYPGGRLVSDFSTTTTNEKHLFDFTNFTSTDNVEPCGRFAATLSAGAGYTWTVPTYTGANLIKAPIRETRVLDWTPTMTGVTSGNGTLVAKYQIVNNQLWAMVNFTLGNTSAIGASVDLSYPFTRLLTSAEILGNCNLQDTGTLNYSGIIRYTAAGPARIFCIKADGTYASYLAVSTSAPFSWGSTDLFQTEYTYNI
jgi:hypothetical protein